jgi:hypothetical protein
MRTNVSDFAVTTLAGGSGGTGVNMGPTDGSFTVASGSLFPTVSGSPSGINSSLPYEPANFVVAIDSELVMCSARSGNSFTVSARGIEGTTAASHTVGTNVVLVSRSAQFDHLWGATPDTYDIDVPPYQRGAYNTSTTRWDFRSTSNTNLSIGSGPSQWDDEMDVSSWCGNGSPWTIAPAVPSNLLPGGVGGDNGAIIDFGQYRRSCMTFRRADNGTTPYYVSRSFLPGSSAPWMVTCKLSHTGYNATVNWWISAHLFVSDSASPAWGAESNMVFVGSVIQGNSIPWGTGAGNVFYTQRAVQAGNIINSGGSNIQATNFGFGQPYFRIAYNPTAGTPTFRCYFGDGLTWQLFSIWPKTMTPRSLGFRFTGGNSSVATREEVVIDWVRVEGVKTSGLDAYWESF